MKNISFLKKNGVDIDKSLELFGNEEKYNNNLGTFLVGIHSCINKLIEFMKQRDLTNYSIYVHSLKTDARYRIHERHLLYKLFCVKETSHNRKEQLLKR